MNFFNKIIFNPPKKDIRKNISVKPYESRKSGVIRRICRPSRMQNKLLKILSHNGGIKLENEKSKLLKNL